MLRGQLFRGAFDLIQSRNDCQHMMRAKRIVFTSLPPITTTMRPAGHFNNRAARLHIDAVISSIGIRLQITFEALQELFRAFALSCIGEVIHNIGMTAVANISPITRQPRAPKRLVDQLHLCVVRVNHFRLQHLMTHEVDQRLCQVRRRGQPIVNRAATDLDTVAKENVFHSIARKMIPELAQHHRGQQARAGQSLIDRLRRFGRGEQRRLIMLRRASIHGSLMHDHLQLRRLII